MNGYEVLNHYFDELPLREQNNPLVLAFGEDLGFIGDVNQALPVCRPVTERGRILIPASGNSASWDRESVSLRGLRPIAEIPIPRLPRIRIAARQMIWPRCIPDCR